MSAEKWDDLHRLCTDGRTVVGAIATITPDFPRCIRDELTMGPHLQGRGTRTATSNVLFQMHKPRLLAVTHATVADLLNDLIRPTNRTASFWLRQLAPSTARRPSHHR
jgi:hypothetical protein